MSLPSRRSGSGAGELTPPCSDDTPLPPSRATPPRPLLRSANDCLYSAALVCCQWGALAQKLLFQRVVINFVEDAMAFRSGGGATRWKVRELVVSAADLTLRGDDCSDVIRACRGVRTMRLEGVREVDFFLFFWHDEGWQVSAASRKRCLAQS